MPVQMIELEEVTMDDLSDEAMESVVVVRKGYGLTTESSCTNG